MKQPRFASLEGARGLAMIFVFLIHLHEFLLPLAPRAWATLKLVGFLYTVGNLAGDFFLVLTGCLIYRSVLENPLPYPEFIRRRLTRIYPVFLTILGLYTAFSILFPATSKLPSSRTQAILYILQNAALMPGLFRIRPMISVSWTLSFIVLFYLAIPCFIRLARLRHRTANQRIAINLAFLASGAGFAMLTHLIPLRVNMLVVGMLLAELLICESRISLPSWIGQSMLAVIPLGILARYAIVQVRHLSVLQCSRTPLQTLITAICLFCFCYCAIRAQGRFNRFLTWTPLRRFGRMSYSYYLGHSLAIKCYALAATPFLAVATRSTLGFWTIQPPLFLLSLVPCIALYHLIEEGKLLYWMTSFRFESLTVRVFDDRRELGQAAAAAAAEALRNPTSAFFAAAPSQNETLEALSQTPGVDWTHLNAFHLDEYAGAHAEAPHSFRRYLHEHLFNLVPPVAHFEGLRGEAPDLLAETERYSALLEKSYPTVGLIGIGENGHIAFNDPPEARFHHPKLVGVVKLTEACRRQQVNDKTFPSLEAVPEFALSVTIPALMRVAQLFVMVPGKRKAEAVRATLQGPIEEACPASILRTHPNAILFLDQDSASLL